jgi:hypothetical protein
VRRTGLLAALLVAAPSVTAGCAAHMAKVTGSLPPMNARRSAAGVRSDWLHEIRMRARTAPRQRFDNPPRGVLLARLRRLERRYGFRVVELRVLRPRQEAPLVVLETSDEHALARNTRWILRAVDPKRPTGDDRTGWRYEGFYLEARDLAGVPFLAVFNYWRGRSAGGGQRASDESLYPFAHG